MHGFMELQTRCASFPPRTPKPEPQYPIPKSTTNSSHKKTQPPRPPHPPTSPPDPHAHPPPPHTKNIHHTALTLPLPTTPHAHAPPTPNIRGPLAPTIRARDERAERSVSVYKRGGRAGWDGWWEGGVGGVVGGGGGEGGRGILGRGVDC